MNERLHQYESKHGFLVCKKCGAADNKKPYKGFRYWLNGDGYHIEPECKYTDSGVSDEYCRATS